MATTRNGVQTTPTLQGAGLVTLADVTTTSSYQHITIPAGAIRVVFYCTNDAYVSIDNSAGGPASNDGPPFAKGVNHVLDCFGSTKMHAKYVSAAGTFSPAYVPGDLGAS